MDLVLPADRPLGELVPSIVDAVFTETPGPRHWQLTRIGGHRLEPSLSLRDNAVADGDLVLLTELVLPSPRPLPTEDSVLVAAGSPPTTRTADVGPASPPRSPVSRPVRWPRSGRAT